MALRAAVISSSVDVDFMAANRPPTFTSGSVSSLSTFSCATARDVAMSNRSRCPAANSSARAWTQVTFFSPSCSQTSRRKSTRLPRLSSSVNRADGSSMASTMPGNPAPVPTSMTVLPRMSACASSAAQSSRCRVATSRSSVMAVRFMTLFFSSSSAA